mgnify:FL=1
MLTIAEIIELDPSEGQAINQLEITVVDKPSRLWAFFGKPKVTFVCRGTSAVWYYFPDGNRVPPWLEIYLRNTASDYWLNKPLASK